MFVSVVTVPVYGPHCVRVVTATETAGIGGLAGVGLASDELTGVGLVEVDDTTAAAAGDATGVVVIVVAGVVTADGCVTVCGAGSVDGRERFEPTSSTASRFHFFSRSIRMADFS